MSPSNILTCKWVICQDYMLFDPFIYHGMSELQDRHRDMRLDVDNMSYEVKTADLLSPH